MKKAMQCFLFIVLLFSSVSVYVTILFEVSTTEYKAIKMPCYDNLNHKIEGLVCEKQSGDLTVEQLVLLIASVFGMGFSLFLLLAMLMNSRDGISQEVMQ